MALRLRGATCAQQPCFKQGSLTDLPYSDSSVDAGLSVDVLEHIAPEDVPKVVDEISRVVRHALLVEIADFKERAQSGEQAGMKNVHLTVQGKSWWTQQFERK